jgi:Bacterial membrane protein YfhO
LTPRSALRRIGLERELWFAVGLAFLFAAWPLLVGRSYFFRDLHLWSIPQRARASAMMRSGHWPSWDALTHGGQPFAGEVNNLALYPTAALSLIFDPVTAVNLEIALHFALAAAAAYALGRVVGLAREPSLLAAFLLCFSGISLSLTNLCNRLFALPSMVLLLLFWHLFVLERRRRWFLLAAAAGALQLLSGSLESLLLSFPLAIAWSLLATYPPDSPSPVARLKAAVLLGILILGLAAVQIVPMAEILRDSRRARGLSAQESRTWSIGLRRLPELVVPGFFGNVTTLDERDYWGAGQEDMGFPYLLSIYVGVVGLIVASAALGSRPTRGLPLRLRGLLGVVSIGLLLVSMGRFLPSAVALRYPSKSLMILPLTLGLLAASRIDSAFFEPDGRGDGRLSGALFAAAALAAVLAAILLVRPSANEAFQRLFFRETPDPRATAGVARGLLHAAAAALCAALVLRRRSSGAALALAAVVGVDLMWAGANVNATAPRSLFDLRPPLLDSLERVLGDGRLYRGPRPAQLHLQAPSNDLFWLAAETRNDLRYNTATGYGVPLVYDEDFDGLMSSRMFDLTREVASLPWNRKLSLLSAASVRAVITDEPITVDGLLSEETGSRTGPFLYRNDRAAAPAELATYWLYVPTAKDARAALAAPGFDPRRHAVLEGEGPPPNAAACRHPDVRVRERSATHEIVETDSECPGFLVFSEPAAPGWRAQVDGRSAELRAANAAFTAVYVEAGRHTVARSYRPVALEAGAAISLLSAAAAIAACAYGRPRRQGVGEATPS